MTIRSPKQVIIDGLISDSYKDDTGLDENQKKAQDGCRAILEKWNEEYADTILDALHEDGYSIVRTSVLEALAR